jgi:hypothetical protein
VSLISVEAANVSAAWLEAARRLSCEPDRKAFHTIVRINEPLAEIPAVRVAIDELLEGHRQQCVDTVANTIFPEAIAQSSRDHAELVDRYVRMYPLLRARYGANREGTYFGRLVQYPAAKEPFDQLGAVINRIIKQRDSGNPKRAARFEASLAVPEDGMSAPIYVPGTDNNPMRYPCLSHCLFQTDAEGRVHLLAAYRYHYLLRKGYGNYLGLGRLLAYVARQTDLQPGFLTVVAGRVHLEPPIVPVRAMLDRFADAVSDS